MIEEGLADSSSVAEFDAHPENCKEIWLNREKLQVKPHFDQFYFNFADVIHHTTLKEIKRYKLYLVMENTD